VTNASLIPAFVNPGAGNFEKARDALASSGHFDVREVDPGKLREVIKEAIASGAKRVVVAGGDGSICAGAAAISGTDVELAVIPAGTLNHFAIDSGIPIDLAEAVKVGIGTKTMTVDVGYAGERLFLNTSSIGAYVTFVRLRDRLARRFGYRLASVIAMVRIVAAMPTVIVEVEVEGHLKRYRTPLVFVGVGERELQLPHLGHRVKNGKRGLHVFVVSGRKRARLLVVALAAVARGVETVRHMPEVDAFLVDRCSIDLRRGHARIAFDGETEVMQTPLEYRIERDVVRLVVPEEAGEATEKAAAARPAS
jgi:diacylglycerol kinase family enzyme